MYTYIYLIYVLCSSSSGKQLETRNCNLNENNINMPNDSILHCGPGQLEEFNPIPSGMQGN